MVSRAGALDQALDGGGNDVCLAPWGSDYRQRGKSSDHG
jgi:hypothetical protein